MESSRKQILIILFVVLLLKVVLWILNMFDVFGSQIDANKGFFFSLFENLSRGFLLIIPFLFLMLEGLKKGKGLYLLLAFGFLLINGFCFVSDTIIHFNESKTDLLIILSALMFAVPVILLYRKTVPKTTYHHARMVFAVAFVLFGLADFLSKSRVEMKLFREYALLFCAITFMAQFFSDRERI